jgi:hypothetical protein
MEGSGIKEEVRAINHFDGMIKGKKLPHIDLERQ